MALVPINSAENYTLKGDYEKSNEILSTFLPKKDERAKYYYLQAVNHFALNDRKNFLKSIEDFDFVSNSETPVRYRNLVLAMKHDLEQWDATPLNDIQRDMRKSADRLENSYAGKKTQNIQEEIVKKLDKLIKEEEDKKNKANASNNPNPSDPNGKTVPGQDKIPNMPAPDTIIMGGKGDGKVDEKVLRKIAEQWGTLPPAARAKVVQDLTKELPPKYEQLIKNYFESLNKFYKVKP